jgi:hypothetical protein
MLRQTSVQVVILFSEEKTYNKYDDDQVHNYKNRTGLDYHQAVHKLESTTAG